MEAKREYDRAFKQEKTVFDIDKSITWGGASIYETVDPVPRRPK
jgi:hypothetical protein